MFGSVGRWLGRRVKSWFKHKDPQSKSTSSTVTGPGQAFRDFGMKSLKVAEDNLNTPWANKYSDTADSQFRQAADIYGANTDFDIGSADPYRNLFRKHAQFGADRIDRTLGNTLAGYDDSSGFGRGGGGTAALKFLAGEQAARQQAELFSQADLDAISTAQNVHGMNVGNNFRRAAGLTGLGSANYGMASQFRMHPLMMANMANTVATGAPQNQYGNTNTNTVNKAGGMPFMKYLDFVKDNVKLGLQFAGGGVGG